jgi:ribonucleoside-diphosphate reductase alpha chain
MLTMLFETGHPWITFKDACNVRSPQQHVGVVHSSNLCTEITLNTSDTEIAVCNLGSINLGALVVDGADGAPSFDFDEPSSAMRVVASSTNTSAPLENDNSPNFDFSGGK